MIKALTPILLLVSAGVFGSGVPTSYKVTPENSSSLGFALEEIETYRPNLNAGVLKYPKSIDGYVVARVQTFLHDLSGRSISSTSADALVSDKLPSVMFTYYHDLYDMTICIQYGRTRNEGMYYDRSYCIDSLSNHLIARN